MANTVTYTTTYDDVLQDRLDHPQNWKEICDVLYTDTRVISSSYESTQPSVQTVTRGTGFAFQDFAQTAETLTISTGRDLGEYVDWGDLAQSPWTKPVELFDRIGARLNEFVESNVLGQHATWTDFGTVDIGGGGASTTQITVSATNTDDIIRGIQREIAEANGLPQASRNGIFIVWRAADFFDYLVAFMQANGFSTADSALRDGVVPKVDWMNVTHYVSNDHTANHLFAGVKKIQRLGILRGTYGRAHTIEFPAGSSNNNLSGVGYYSRVDIGHLTPTGLATLVFDVNVT